MYAVAEQIWWDYSIPVCWLNDGYAPLKGWVQDYLTGENSWSAYGQLEFVGWGKCDSSWNGIGIEVKPSLDGIGGAVDSLNHTSDGRIKMTLRGDYNKYYTESVAIHEFGHAIGFAHEHNRPDAECDYDPQGPNGNLGWGRDDSMKSVMSYCTFTNELSQADKLAVEALYGPIWRLRSAHGKYLTSQSNGDVTARANTAGDYETFRLVCHPDKRCGLLSKRAKYLVAEEGGGGDANWDRSHLFDYELFELNASSLGPKFVVNLRSRNEGRYLVAEEDGDVRADRTQVGPWECFEAERVRGSLRDFQKWVW